MESPSRAAYGLQKNKKLQGLRDRTGEVLFIDARKIGTLVDRARRDLSDEDVAKISDTYHTWCGQSEAIDEAVHMKTFLASVIPLVWMILNHMVILALVVLLALKRS